MLEIKITIISEKDGQETTKDVFTDYRDAIDFLDAMENKEMDKNHAYVMSEHK